MSDTLSEMPGEMPVDMPGADAVAALFTRADGEFLFARWGGPSCRWCSASRTRR